MPSDPFKMNIGSALISELHSRPFLSMEAGSRIVYLTLLHSDDAPAPIEALAELLSEWGVTMPENVADFYQNDFGNYVFKWERHTEFSSYMIYIPAPQGEPFAAKDFAVFPDHWLNAQAPHLLSSAFLEITKPSETLREDMERYRPDFRPESFAAALVLGGAAAIASDFQADENGHIRMLMIPAPTTGPRRIGRVAQRLIEIETYTVSALMGIKTARDIARKLPVYEREFQPVISGISKEKSDADASLHSILEMAGKTESLISQSSFRFGATKAYAELVSQRIHVLHEERLKGFQLFSEFMMRRFEPGMRTVISTEERLESFSERLERAANFLRTKVEVANSEGQRAQLEAMNKRAEAQLRLQETVEGLSVVAISYYAVSLLGYVLAPLGKYWHIDKSWLMALSVLPTVLIVWLFIRSIKNHVSNK